GARHRHPPRAAGGGGGRRRGRRGGGGGGARGGGGGPPAVVARPPVPPVPGEGPPPGRAPAHPPRPRPTAGRVPGRGGGGFPVPRDAAPTVARPERLASREPTGRRRSPALAVVPATVELVPVCGVDTAEGVNWRDCIARRTTPMEPASAKPDTPPAPSRRSAQVALAVFLAVLLGLLAFRGYGNQLGARPTDHLPGGARIDLNTADRTELAQVPGIGPERAKAIEEYRNAKGRFRSVEELQEVSGFG